jgi:hypothetical protein
MNGNMGKSAMMYRSFILILLALFSAQVFAQSNPLRIELAPLQSDVQVNLSWRSTVRPAGLLLNVPAEVQLIPISIQIDNRAIWLINDSAVPARDSVIAWQSGPEGLILLFRQGLLDNGSVLDISCHSNLVSGVGDSALVQIRTVQVTSEGIESASSIITSGLIPARNRQTEN